MATYTTDLATIHLCDAASASWTEPVEFADGVITLPELDYFIQNTGCFSKSMGTSISAKSGGIYNYGSTVGIASPNVFIMWVYFGAPNALATQANGGITMFCGNSLTAYKKWYVLGSDTYTYGGWRCIPVDPNVASNLDTGTPTGVWQYFGAAANLGGISAVSKGNPFGIDGVRYGRAEARVVGTGATFSGLASANDAIAARWGLFQAIDGGYLMQGLMVLGYGGAVTFSDTNKNILIGNTIKVTSAFNKIEIRGATSSVTWTGIQISALGTTSKGTFIMTDNATVAMTSCMFNDLDAFTFQSNATLTSTTFRRCGLITQGGADITSCLISSSPVAVAVLSDNPSAITYTTFESAGTGHAVQCNTIGSYDWEGNLDTGYTGTRGSNMVSESGSADAMFYNNSTGLITLTVTEGGVSPSVRNGVGATTSVVSGITLKMIVTDADGFVADANAYIDNNNETPFIMQTTTDEFGEASTGYSAGAATGTTWRVRKYGYKPFDQLVDIAGANIDLPVTLIIDPQQT